ncbi:MMPL family transporter [Rasiella sp. SM2506]|uniref:MMPL family transporter n=1 Tax=Rasiella sp. SM2506 TaxID=3423914 RepID=UPI003D7B91DE
MSNFFLRTYRLFQQQKRMFWLGLVVVFGVLAFAASTIEFEEDISKLIPVSAENKPLQKVLETANFSDKIIVHIQKTEAGTTEDLTNYATELVDSLTLNFEGYIKDIQGKVAEETALEALDFVYENIPLFLTQKDYQHFALKLNNDSISEITKQNYNTLVSPTGLLAKKTIARDPLGMSLLGIQQLRQLGINEDFELENGFLVSKDRDHLLLFITPTFATSETDKNEAFVESLYALQENLNLHYKGTAEASYFGGAFIAVANAQQIKSDIQFTVSIALAILLVVFILFYRKLTIPIILFVPTVFGALVSIAFLAVFRGEISAISLGIGSVLLGVTLDYSLHILTHIRAGDSVELVFQDVVKPIVMSSLTTALAFLCLLFIDSQALQDLGIFAAVSVLGSAFFSLMFIPQVYKGELVSRKKATVLDRFSGYPFHKNKVLLGVVLAALVLSVFTYNKVIFNKDISQLNYIPESLQQAEKELDILLNTQSKSLYIAAYGNTLQEALEANDVALSKLVQLKNGGDVITYTSIAGLVTSEKVQQEKIDRWNEFWNTSRTDSTAQLLQQSGTANGFTFTSFQPFYDKLKEDFEVVPLSSFEAINTIRIDDFIATKNGFTTVTSLVKVSEENSEAVKLAFATTENVLLVDRLAMNESLLGNLKNDFNTLIYYCLGIVVLLLLLFYRSLKCTLVTIVPIILTWFITLGIMGFFGLQFNVFNVLITTFIFGLGVDYSIFITNGLLKDSTEKTVALATHKTAILLSVITTVLGVGVLVFAKHPALHSIAVVAVIGILSAMVISFTVQPLLYHLLNFRGTKKHSK